MNRKHSFHVVLAVTDNRIMHNIGHGVWADARPDSYPPPPHLPPALM